MLIHYRENGFIDVIHSDPDEEALNTLLAMGGYKHIPAEMLPEQPLVNVKGEPILDAEGKQIIASPGIVQPEITHDLHYFDIEADEVKLRPTIARVDDSTIKADGKDTVTVTGLPKPIVVKVDETEYEITDGKIVFATTDAGTYHFVIDQWPYVPWTMKVTAL